MPTRSCRRCGRTARTSGPSRRSTSPRRTSRRSRWEGLALQGIGSRYFARDPGTQPSWERALAEQTPPPLPVDLPVLVGQGLADTVVLPPTTARLQERWCTAGSRLTVDWIGTLQHVPAGNAVGPLAVTDFEQRLAGIPAGSTCGTTLPVAAARG